MVRTTGRPEKTWRRVMEKDCPTLQLNKDAMDLSEWRKLIKDIGKDRE